MRIARYSRDGEVSYGIVEGTGDRASVAAVDGHPAVGPVRPTGEKHPLADVLLLAPVLPSKIVAVGRNYAEHIQEMGGVLWTDGGSDDGSDGGSGGPPEPLIFLKPSSAVAGPGDAIFYPVGLSERVDYEGELAVVIGRLCRDVPVERAGEVILGYTCANDVTARDLQRRDGQWTRAKGFDSFCPLGPWIETEVDASDLAITTTVGGEIRQAGRTKQLIHDIPHLIAHISRVMTLLPGDVILTGTPAGVGPLRIGDEVSVTVEAIGTLTNRVVARD